MRIAILGDIHSNLEALQAVLNDAEEHSVDQYVCLGDIVGYNANPVECLEMIRGLECPTIKGNHDELASEEEVPDNLSLLAAEGMAHSRQLLTPDHKAWLRDLKLTRLVRDFTVVHATLDTPARWGYVFKALDAAASFTYQHTQLCFHGHTHVPAVFVRELSVKRHPDADSIQIETGKKYFINVGSVGQPRDRDPRASYVIYNSSDHSLEFRRITYDIALAQQKIIAAGLPRQLADRLALGM
jgi:predicted phosphodiesterase